METAVIIIFALSLLLCITLDYTIIYALIFGYIIFFTYGICKKHTPRTLLAASLRGIRTVSPMLITFILIGSMTALWRASGTIAFIVYYASDMMLPEIFLLCTFLLCAVLSVLTGTSFGTAAIMGVICMTIGKAMGVSQMLLGGAVLSGICVGDRCSPMSSSALLVCQLTQTDIYMNIRNMIKSAAVPFLASCLVYFILGFWVEPQGAVSQMQEIFSRNFNLNAAAVLPAVMIVFLSCLRVKVRKTMICSIVTAGVICTVLQGMGAKELISTAIWGYQALDPALSAMINGGGICSMFSVAVIVCISSSFAGLFETTGLLLGLQSRLDKMMKRITPFGCVLVTASVTAMIACNQTLPIMLTKELCRKAAKTPEDMALMLEDSAVVIPMLIPWSIAGAVPLATIGAGSVSVIAACYLYLLPLWSFINRRKEIRKREIYDYTTDEIFYNDSGCRFDQ